ncbi:MAG: hypothetical protein ACI9WU_005526, partial [Myxococcota bacterium]
CRVQRRTEMGPAVQQRQQRTALDLLKHRRP